MKRSTLVAGLAVLVLGVGACTPSTPNPNPSAPAAGGSAPAGSASAPAGSSAPAAPAEPKALSELLLSGDAAGLKLNGVSADNTNRAGTLASLVSSLNVEPEECKKIMVEGQLRSVETGNELAVAEDGDAAYTVAVQKGGKELAEGRAGSERCQNFKIVLGAGIKIDGNIAVSDLITEGVEEGYRAVTNVNLPQVPNQRLISEFGKVGDVTIIATGNGPGVDQNKVDELFNAQVEKVKNG